MRTSTSSYIVELPLRVNDQQNRFLEKAFEFGRTLYNATLGTALGRLQRMRETQEWRVARDMPKRKARTKAFSAVHKAFGLTEFGLTIIANNHRKASGRKDIGAHGKLFKNPRAKPDGTKMFCSAFLHDARMCCFFANAIVKY